MKAAKPIARILEHDQSVIDGLRLVGVLRLLKADPGAWHRLKRFPTQALASDRADRLVRHFHPQVQTWTAGDVLYAALTEAAAA